jgi:anti-sigma factor RsiW
MKGCPDEPRLIRWMAGELPPAAAGELDAHLGNCESCREHCRQLKSMWELLGELRDEAPTRDLTAQILSAARRDEAPRWAFLGRQAAAIALAAGLGALAGWLTPAHRTPQTPLAVVSQEELLARTGLDVLVGGEPIVAQVLDQGPVAADRPREDAL